MISIIQVLLSAITIMVITPLLTSAQPITNTLLVLLLPPSERKGTTVRTIAVGRTTLTNTVVRAWQQL
ncbi:hypothetical protein HQ545_08560 [Candidatus Woesearchaeota archaeon]|nr:hypothetical protein [Candidatus Woesearchaeota archaeon]